MESGDDFVVKVLMAFRASEDINQIIESISNEFKRKAHQVQIKKECLLSKIEEILDENHDYSTLILQENLEQDNHIKIDYLNKISEKFPKLNIVYIINNRHCESNYIRDIYDAGIYNCIFDKDASIANIVYIALNPRTRNEAESYYGLATNTDETEKIYSSSLMASIGEIKKNMKKDSKNKAVVVKEKVVYKTPRDYQKVIGIYSPYSVGKTVIAANLAMYYVKNKLNVTLVDTDYYKKDLLYYFDIDNSDFLKMQNLYRDIDSGKEIDNISLYEINMSKRLKIFTDHRDSIYKVTPDMVNTIVRNSDSNIVVIDISRDLENEIINEILSLCDEKIIVVDKMLSTLNGIPYKLHLKNNIMKKLKLIVNKDVNIRSLSNKEIEIHFKDIKLFGMEKYSLSFDELFFIPNKFELIAEALANREVAYGKDSEFDSSIEKIARSLYQINTTKSGKRGLLKKMFNR